MKSSTKNYFKYYLLRIRSNKPGCRYMGKVLQLVYILLFTSLLASCATSSKSNIYQTGLASWYGDRFHGRKTASGEVYNMHAMTAAHPKLPFGTKLMVTSKSTGKSVQVRVNDRGPFAKRRIIDLSFAAAKKIGIIEMGEDEVEISIP